VPSPAAGTIAAIRLIEGVTVYRKESLAGEKSLKRRNSDLSKSIRVG